MLVKIRVPLKHLSNFWRTLETLLISSEIKVDQQNVLFLMHREQQQL